jgi:NAD(P)H-hydrate epimerase
MRILQTEEVKKADLLTCEIKAIDSIELMNQAAALFSDAFLKKFPDCGKGLIVIGPGNNGGDGLVVARLLAEKQDVSVFIPDWLQNFSVERVHQETQLPASVKKIRGGLDEFKLELTKDYAWLCDALFGVGGRELEGDSATLVLEMNSFSGLKIAIDQPSGFLNPLNKDNPVFEAHWVGTFHCPKMGFLFPSNQRFVPEFEVLDIGLLEPEAEKEPVHFLEKSQISALLQKRKRFSHKGHFGHGILIAGSTGKMGAAVLAARAMLRSGIGLATVYGPKSGRIILQTAIPEAMWISDPDKNNFSQCPPLGYYQAIGIGPGLGTLLKTGLAFRQVLERSVHPMVIDADALNLLGENPGWFSFLPACSLLTPHPKEFERMAGKSNSDQEVMTKVLEFSKKHQVILILKGAFTLICHPDGRAWFNSSGNPGMATAGSGDVLTGILTGLLAQGYDPLSAAMLGVYVHGLAGDLAAKNLGQNALIASDLVEYLGRAFLNLAGIE